MRKSTRLLAIFLAVLMTVSVLPVSAFAVSVAESGVITAVDPNNEYVWETKFPYNYEGDNTTEYWSKRESYVETPTFYDTIPAMVDGVETTIPVTGWTLVAATDKDGNPIMNPSYDGRAIGTTYTFSPEVSNAFTWECEVPEIKAKIVDAGWTSRSSYQGFLTGDGSTVGYVVRATGSGSSVNEIYDATGCNKIVDFSVGTGLDAYGGKQNGMNANDVQPTKTGATVPSTEATKLVIYGTTIKRMYAAGKKTLHNGDSYAYLINSTATGNIYAAGSDNGNMVGDAHIYLVDSKVNGTVHGGGASATLDGDAYLDITGNSTVGGIQGGGSKATSGTTFVNIHGLTSNASIGNITRTNVTKLVVDLDDTSKYLLSSDKIAGITTEGKTDANVTVKINNEEFKGVVADADVAGIPEIILVDEAATVLPTTFGGVSGFTWSGDDSTVGEKKFTLTAPDGYFFENLNKTREYTIYVNAGAVEVEGVSLDKTTASISLGEEVTLTATVEPENATDKTVTWKSDNESIATVEDGVVTGVGVGTTTITVSAGSASDTCEVTVNQATKITAVDTSELVMETKFLYSADPTDAVNRWWSSGYSNVTEPKFYDELTVSVAGAEPTTLSGFTWKCDEYDSTAVGETFTFTAVAPAGYVFDASVTVPAITVKIVPGTVIRTTDHIRAVTSENEPINLVVKGDSGIEGFPNVIYDATGCNNLFMYTGADTDVSGGFASSPTTAVYGGLGNATEDLGTANTLYNGEIEYDTKITLTGGANVSAVYASSRGYSPTGDAYVDVYGKVTIKTIHGGTYKKNVLNGTTYVDIHDLDEESSIQTIQLAYGDKLVVNLDDTSAHLIDNIKDWKTNENIEVYVNEKEVVVVSELDIATTEYNVAYGTPLADVNLPTSFEVGGQVVDGFMWEGEYDATRSGTYTLTLKAPQHIYLDVEVAVTVTVEPKTASYFINSITTQTATLSVDYKTSIEDVMTLLPTEFVANDGALTVPASAFDWVSEDYDGYAPGEYTFKAVITDEDYRYSDGVEPFKAVVTVKTPTTQGTVVTKIDLPVNYTVFTKDTGTVTMRDSAGNGYDETRPIKFYDKLSAVAYENGVRKDIEITGIEWEGVKDRTDANGEYWIYTIKSYSGEFEIAPEILANTTITAYKTEGTYSSSSGNMKSNTTIIVPAVVKLSGLEAYASGYKGYPGMAAMDATGFNSLYKNIGLPNTLKWFAGNSRDVVSDVTLVMDDGVSATMVYGGGYGAKVTGDSTVTIKKNVTILGDIYAGSYNDDFKGSTTINIGSGTKVAGKICAGGLGAYDGDVTINIDSNVTVGSIVLGETEANSADSVVINVTSDFDLSVIDCVDSGKVKVFVDGVEKEFIKKIDFGSFKVEVEHGAVSDYRDVLPKVYATRVDGSTFELPENTYTWKSENQFDGNKSGDYVFTLEFGDSYTFINDAEKNNTLIVYVKVAPEDIKTVSRIESTIPQIVSVASGTPAEKVNILSSVIAYAYGVGESESDAQLVEIYGVKWTSSDYNPDVLGEYTFTMVLPDGYVTNLQPATVTVSVVKFERPTITSIKIPVTHTYFTNGTVSSPEFYDTLEADVLYSNSTTETVTLRGLKWVNNGTYAAAKVGNYDFTIDPTTIDAKYDLADGLLETSKITVTVVDTTIAHNTGYYRSNTAKILPIHMTDSGEDTTLLNDLTGCNKILSAGISTAARVFGGGPYHRVAEEGQKAHLVMSSGTLGLVVAGSQGSAFTGDAEINILGTAVITDVVAGTLNEAFNGNTLITLDGEAEISRIIAGGDYRTGATTTGSSGIIVGSQDAVAYNGTITINVADTFEGSVGKIEKRSEGKLIINCPATFPYTNYVDLTDPTVEVYVDGERVQYVTEVKMPETAVYNVTLGTAVDTIVLPSTLTATVNGSASTINNVTWTCENYDANTAGKYAFKPVVSDAYNVSDSNIADIFVTVRVLTANAGQSVITGFEQVGAVSASLGTAQKDLALPTTVKATVNGQTISVDVDGWKCANYDGSVYGATYTFTAVVSGEYALASGVSAPTVVVTVTDAKIVEIYLPVTETTFPRGTVESPVFYDTLKVKLDNGAVVEMSGFEWTVKDYNKNTVGTYTATINAAPANCQFASSLNVPSIKVNVIRKQYDVMETDAYVYLYGIPTVIDEENGKTYLYDMTGCNKTSSKEITGKSVYAGSPANSASLGTTMIEMRGGKVNSLFGASRNSTRVTGTAYIYMLGGSATAIYGGGNGSTGATTKAIVNNVYVYVEDATVTSRITGCGYNGAAEGDVTIIVKNSTVNTIFGGSNQKKDIMTVGGKVTMKILDGSKVSIINGAGVAGAVNELEVYLSKNALVTSRLLPVATSTVTKTAKIFYETGFDLSKVYTEGVNVELYEGHFLEDRETFVTDREISIVRNAGLLRGEVYVDLGTTVDNIGLPTTAEGEIKGVLETVSGITYTPVTYYDGDAVGTYEFAVNIPDGYNVPPTTLAKAATVKVVVTEPVSNEYVTAFDAQDTAFTLANGTAIENAGLPSAYTALLTGGRSKDIPVKKWKVTDENGQTVTYDRYTAGTYVFTPDFGNAYKVLAADVPTHTVTITANRPHRDVNKRYLAGVPAEITNVNGVVLVLDKNGNYLEEAGTFTIVYGGSNRYNSESADITMNSGTIYAIYGGGNLYETGDIKITMNGGSVSYLYVGGYKSHSKNIDVVINSGTITSVWAGNISSVDGRVTYEVNGGTITSFYAGPNGSEASIEGTPQAAEEVLAPSSIRYPGKPIVVEEGENIAVEFVQNGGTIKTLYGAGSAANTRVEGSVKLYINGGKVTTICGGGAVPTAYLTKNVYIKVAPSVVCDTIYANAPGQIYGKAYVIVPESFNRYNIIGWNEDGEIIDGDTGNDFEDEDAALGDAFVTAEVIVSGGYYEEGMPVRVLYVGATETVFARGVPIRIIGDLDSILEDEEVDEIDATDVTTYVEYFDENYDPETETPEIFSYETYVDEEGNQLYLEGVWRRLANPLAAGATAVIYGGGMQGTTDKYPSTYVEFLGGCVKGIYGGGKNDTVGAANLIINPEGPHNTGVIYAGGYQDANTLTNEIYVKMLGGDINIMYAGGYNVTNRKIQVDITGGNVNYLYMGGYANASITSNTTTVNLTNCSVKNIYGGGYGPSSKTIGDAYININENVDINGYIYAKGSAEAHDGNTSGPLKKNCYIQLNDTSKASSQFKKIKYTKAQAPYVYVGGVPLGEMPDVSTATYEHADKKVEITTAQASDYRGNRPLIFLNGIPTVVAGDGNGHSYVYQAKTKDGTLNVYQKNADGTFKYDENGKRISNIVRDPVTGQAIKGPKLVDMDVVEYIMYGGANNKSVEDTYIEFHNGGGVWIAYAGCRGGNTGYDEQGNEVGLCEVRQFGGGAFDLMYMGNTIGFDASGKQTVNVKTAKNVFLGIGGGSKYVAIAGDCGIVGSEEKFMEGYYNKAGEVISYTDEDDGQTYEITGAWEDYNLDVTKEEYEAYYEASNAYFNGEGNSEFVNSHYYVDPYDDHYTIYALYGQFGANHLWVGNSGSNYNLKLNRIFGNAYVRQSAYGLKYDAELDMFVENYNDYIGLDQMQAIVYGGSNTGIMYNDIRFDWEGVEPGTFWNAGKVDAGGINKGHTYLNMLEDDSNPFLKNTLYNSLKTKSAPNVTLKPNFFPRWSFTAAWALGIDEDMAQIAIDQGFITEVSDPKDVRIHMLSADDAAKLLNYYYTGSFEEGVTSENALETEGFKNVFDASNDKGKFTIRHFELRNPNHEGLNRYIVRSPSRFGDGQLIVFPNGQTMIIDVGQSESETFIRNIRYTLETAAAAGMGDGNTIDYLVITHYHGDHHTNTTPIVNAFDVKNIIFPPFDMANGNKPSYHATIEAKSAQNIKEGKEPINIIRVQRGDQFVIGEGDEKVVIDVLNPGDHSYRTFSLAEAIRQINNGNYSSFANPCSIVFMFNFQGQKYFTGGDIREDAETSMLRTYGRDVMKADVMKFSHHGHATSNLWNFVNAVNPEVAIMNQEILTDAGAPVPIYCRNNNTGGSAEKVFITGVDGSIKVTMDGKNIIATPQFRAHAYDSYSDEYKNLEASYIEQLDRVAETIDSLTVVADNATAPYGTPYIWNSYAEYINSEYTALENAVYSGSVSLKDLQEYKDSLTALEEFIEDATMYGGTDNTPDVEVPGTPGTDVGGNDTTTPGTSGGIIGDIGGGDAGSGIGGGAGGAAPGGAGPVGPAGPSVDDGETTDPVTPDDNRRFIDVAETDWFNKAVNYVADNNYFQGVSENEFDPDGKMTRAMLVTVIGRIAKADVSQAKSDFADVEDGSWYADYVAWAAENGIVTGVGEGKFAPNDNVTREQIAAILMRYAATKGIDVSADSTEKYDSMKDTANVSGYAVDALKWATANGIINGAEGNINPKGNATRAEVAQMIMNFCNTFSI